MHVAVTRREQANNERGAQALDMLPPRLLCIALVIALVSTVISLSASAAEADGAAAIAYESPEAAFTGVFLDSGLGERGYRENREYAAAFYEMPDGRWYSTAVVAGGRTESAIPYHAVPEAAQQVVGAHTHGQPQIPEDAWHLYGVDFSQADLRNAVHNYRTTHGRIATQFLLTSELKVLRLTLTGDPVLGSGVAFVRSAEEARRSPGAIHGTTEILAQLAIPAAVSLSSAIVPAPGLAPRPAQPPLALHATSAGYRLDTSN